MTPSELDRRYPYDSANERVPWAALGTNYTGLDKLRAVKDRNAAWWLYQLWTAAEKRKAIEDGRRRYGAPRAEQDGKMRQAGER
jgi:hypothetical protein